MAYVKLVPSILTSTVWAESPATKLTWVTMLVLADRDGLVPARAPGIARAAGLEVDDVRKALAIFASPDPDSRTRDFDGRRIEETDEGILILNYEKYRDTADREERNDKAKARAKRSYERRKVRADKLGIDIEESEKPSKKVAKDFPCEVCGEFRGTATMAEACAAVCRSEAVQ